MKIDKNSIAVISVDANKVASVKTVGGKNITSLLSSKVINTAVEKDEKFFWLTDDGKWVREGGVGERKRLGKGVKSEVYAFIAGEVKAEKKAETEGPFGLAARAFSGLRPKESSAWGEPGSRNSQISVSRGPRTREIGPPPAGSLSA